MTTVRMATRLIGVASLVAMTLLGSAAAEEKLVGTYGEVRTVLAFKASPAAVQKLLPEGWEPAPIAAGPSKDANLNVVFIDGPAAIGAGSQPSGKSFCTAAG